MKRSDVEREEMRRQADRIDYARRRGEMDGRALAASETAKVNVPSFETLLELDGYLTGCYNGYRTELHAFDLTFEDFKPIIEARGAMVL